MKKTVLLLSALLFIFLQSCQEPTIGSGAAEVETRSCKDFNAVITDLPGNIHIVCKQDTAYSCSISAQKNILPFIECSNENKELLIRFKRNSNIKKCNDINIELSMPTVKSIKVLGAGNAKIDGLLVSNELLCAMMGSGNIDLENATIGILRADITGSGNINIQNSTCLYSELAIKGSGNINAQNSASDSVKAIVAGSGNIECLALKNIDAEINGNGKIYYSGNPKVSRSKIGGNGVIEKK